MEVGVQLLLGVYEKNKQPQGKPCFRVLLHGRIRGACRLDRWPDRAGHLPDCILWDTVSVFEGDNQDHLKLSFP